MFQSTKMEPLTGDQLHYSFNDDNNNGNNNNIIIIIININILRTGPGGFQGGPLKYKV